VIHDDDEPDYEAEEEKSPERLKRKWDIEDLEEEIGGKKTIECPHCGKLIDQRSLVCLFCEKKVYFDSGFLGRLARIFIDGKWVFIIVAIMIVVFVFTMMF
jgi:hypothetical protein